MSVERRSLLRAMPGVALASAMAPAQAADVDALTPPSLSLAFRLRVLIGPPQELGMVNGVRKRVIPITGGTVEGPRLQGRVLPGGADWQSIRADGTADILARYTLEAQDGTLISVTNPGYRHGPPEVLARIAAGQVPHHASLRRGERQRPWLARAHGLSLHRRALQRPCAAGYFRHKLNDKDKRG